MNFPVFDFHCDTALALLGEDLMGGGSLRSNKLHIDLERAGTLPGYAQCFACFTSPMEKLPGGSSGKRCQGAHVRHPNHRGAGRLWF